MQLLKTVLVCCWLSGLACGVALLMFGLKTVAICHNESSFHDAALRCMMTLLEDAQGACSKWQSNPSCNDRPHAHGHEHSSKYALLFAVGKLASQQSKGLGASMERRCTWRPGGARPGGTQLLPPTMSPNCGAATPSLNRVPFLT